MRRPSGIVENGRSCTWFRTGAAAGARLRTCAQSPRRAAPAEMELVGARQIVRGQVIDVLAGRAERSQDRLFKAAAAVMIRDPRSRSMLADPPAPASRCQRLHRGSADRRNRPTAVSQAGGGYQICSAILEVQNQPSENLSAGSATTHGRASPSAKRIASALTCPARRRKPVVVSPISASYRTDRAHDKGLSFRLP